jgi:exopolysaccharide production protein ExoQ
MTRPAASAHDTDVFIDLRRNRVPGARGGQVRDAAFETVLPGRGRRRKPIWIDLRTFSLDGAYAFLLFAAMLFVQQAGSLSGAVMAGLPLLYMAVRRRQLGEILATRWLLLLVPVFTLLSVVWSEAPGVSAKYGVEMLLTAAAGIGLSAATRPAAVIKGACLAFALYVAVALGFGHSVGIGVGDGGEAFAGLSDSKNLLADIASTGALLALTTLFLGLRQKRPFWALLGFAVVAADVYVLAVARSAGAVLGVSAAAVALLGLALLSGMSRRARVGVITLLLISAGVFAAVVRNLGSLLLTFGEQMFDKDPTLTGRTYLWYRAQDLIAEKPLFGRGYFAFWRQGNTDAEGLWQYAGIVGRDGFNFHNTLVELTVQLGMIGAAVYCIVGLIGLLGLGRQLVERPSLPLCFWGAYMMYVLVRAPLEAVGYSPFYFSTFLLFGAAGYGLQRLPRRAPQMKGYSPQALRLRAYYASQRSRAEAMAAGAP